MESETVMFLREIPVKVYMKDAKRSIEHRSVMYFWMKRELCACQCEEFVSAVINKLSAVYAPAERLFARPWQRVFQKSRINVLVTTLKILEKNVGYIS